jgi:two-component system cell cycle response regulator
VTLRVRLSLAFLIIVVAPLAAAAVIVGRGVPHALDTSAQNRLTAAEAATSSWVQQTCVRARLSAEIRARETAALSGPARASAAPDIVDRALADYAVVVGPAGHVVSQAGDVGGARPSATALGSCSATSGPKSDLAAIADSVGVRSSTGRRLGRAAVAESLDVGTLQRISRAVDAPITLARAGAAHGVAGAGRIATVVPVPGSDVAVIVSVKRSSVHHLVTILIAVLIAAIVLSAAIGTWLARLTTRPLAELSGAAARVAEGDLDAEFAAPGDDEVGQLAAAFNEMTRELRGYAGEVEASRDRLQGSFSRLGDTLTATHDLGRILGVVLDTAVDSVDAVAGAVYVIQSGREGLQLRASHALESRAAATRLPLGEGIISTVATTGQPLQGRVGTGGLTPAAGEPSATDVLAVPLRTGSGVLGVLSLYDRKDGHSFAAGDVAIIKSFVAQAAVALDNVLLHQEAQQLSVTDALTGLGNFRSFQNTLAREIDRAARFGHTLGLLMIDLDRFKTVNDVYGHPVGNDVLVEVANRLRAEVREVDIIARYGGEEFVVVLPESNADGAGHTADRIRAAMRQEAFRVAGIDLAVTVSIGVAVFPAHGQNAADLIRAADEAMSTAKAAGRDQWQLAADR